MNQTPNIEEKHTTREVEEWEREFVEQGSDLEHERWAKWQSYLHSKCVEHSDGKGEWVCFPAELFKRWERQIATRYADLSEDEKESDRKEARTYLPLVHHQLQKAREEERERIKTTIETLLLGVQPLPDDADTFMGEHEKTAVKAGYMVKEWVMEAFKEPDHSELDQDSSNTN